MTRLDFYSKHFFYDCNGLPKAGSRLILSLDRPGRQTLELEAKRVLYVIFPWSPRLAPAVTRLFR